MLAIIDDVCARTVGVNFNEYSLLRFQDFVLLTYSGAYATVDQLTSCEFYSFAIIVGFVAYSNVSATSTLPGSPFQLASYSLFFRFPQFYNQFVPRLLIIAA